MYSWKRLISCGVAALVLSLAPGLRAAEASTNDVRVMSLEDCVQQALQHNFDVQIQRKGPEISLYDLRSAYGGYDPVISANVSHNSSTQPGGVDAEGRPYIGSESESDGFGGSVGGLMPFGLNYRLGGGFSDSVINRTDFITVTNIIGTNVIVSSIPIRSQFENTGGQIGALELRQPLMRNFWVDGTRYGIQISQNALKGSELTLRQQIMATITAVESAYYNLIFAQESVVVQEKALELAQRLLEENKTRVRVGAMAELDEKQSEAEVAGRRADLLSAQQVLDNQQNFLKNLLTTDYVAWHKVQIRPSVKLEAVPVSVQLQDSWMKGMTQRPDLEQARLALERQRINLRYQKNQLFPQLDVVGTFGYAAGGTPEFSSAFDQIARQDAPFYSYRAEVSIPLGNRAARNNYKAAKAAQEQLVLQLKRLEQNIMVEIDDAVGNVRTAFERVAATREARKFAAEAWEAEKKKLANGKSTSFVVLQLQKDLVTAASTEIRALADYNIALAALAQSEGSTLERHRIDFTVK